jgi:hypothetical protein
MADLLVRVRVRVRVRAYVSDVIYIFNGSFNLRYEEPQYCNYLKRYKVRRLDGVFKLQRVVMVFFSLFHH